MAEAVAAVVSLGKLAAGHGRHSPETLWGVAPEDEWPRQVQQQSRKEAVRCVYLGSYSSLTARKTEQPELHYEFTIWVKRREHSQQRQPIRGRIGSVLQEKQCISLHQYHKDKLLYSALSVLYSGFTHSLFYTFNVFTNNGLNCHFYFHLKESAIFKLQRPWFILTHIINSVLASYIKWKCKMAAVYFSGSKAHVNYASWRNNKKRNCWLLSS